MGAAGAWRLGRPHASLPTCPFGTNRETGCHKGRDVQLPGAVTTRAIGGMSYNLRPVRRSASSPEEYVERLRNRVLDHLAKQGFKLTETGLLAPVPRSKDELRSLHQHAVAERRASARPALE